jgi:hypothetical protein
MTSTDIMTAMDLDATPHFSSLKDFETIYNVKFNDEERQYADNILHILNTGTIPEDYESRPFLICTIGNYYDFVKRDFETALRYYIMSGDMGYEGYSLAARIYEETYKNTEKACEYYEKEIALFPDKSGVLISYAMLLMKQDINDDETFEKITSILEKSLEFGCTESLFMLGLTYSTYGATERQKLKGISYMIQCLSQCSRDFVLQVLDTIIHILYNTNTRIQPKTDDNSQIFEYLFYSLQNSPENIVHKAFSIIAHSMNSFTVPISPADKEALSTYAAKYPAKTQELTEEICVPIWKRVAPKYGIACANPKYDAKVKYHSKLQVCDICMSDEQKNCIPVTWCMHYVCTDCYWSVVDKPCPFCRT